MEEFPQLSLQPPGNGFNYRVSTLKFRWKILLPSFSLQGGGCRSVRVTPAVIIHYYAHKGKTSQSTIHQSHQTANITTLPPILLATRDIKNLWTPSSNCVLVEDTRQYVIPVFLQANIEQSLKVIISSTYFNHALTRRLCAVKFQRFRHNHLFLFPSSLGHFLSYRSPLTTHIKLRVCSLLGTILPSYTIGFFW